MLPRGLSSVRIFACVALGAVALVFALALNKSCFEIDQDGAAWQVYMDYQVRDRAAFSQLGVDPHQGDFDSYYPLINDFTLPGAIYRLAGATAAPSRVATYAIYTAALFAVVVLLGRAFAVDTATALFSAFIAAFFFPPLLVHHTAQTFRFMQLNPHWIQLIILSALAVVATWKLDGKWSFSRILLLLVPAVCITIEVMSLGAMVIFTPAVVVYGAGALFFSPGRAALVQRITAGALVVLVVIVTGQAAYLYGLEAYSAYQAFGHEFDRDYPYLANMSIAFSFPLGTLLIALGVIGALLARRGDNHRLAGLATTHLIATALFFIACVVFYLGTYRNGYRTSAPMYFETTYMPFAALFCASAIVDLAKRLAARRNFAVLPPGLRRLGVAEACLWLFLVAVAGYNLLAAALRSDECARYQLYARTRSTPVTEILQNSIGLLPGLPFRGIVSTIDWVGDNSPSVDYNLMHSRNAYLRSQSGNDHRQFGLWHFDVPTTYQYFTFITAPYYLLMTEFLARPTDRQTRSGLVLTRVDAKMLRLWGIRYLLTDRETNVGHEVASLTTALLTMHLIELDGANTGNYSPTAVHRVPDFHSGISLMHEPAFDGAKTVITDVTDDSIEGPLVPASDAHLVFETYGFRLTARSEGKSVLVLPPQFSRCWSISGSGSPRLFRANLMQIGVEFSGALDAQLVFRHGPLFASSCRLQDVQDIKRLQISRGRVLARILPDQG